ncbi:protein spaetzle isoform X2 [Chironomus tepperi]|uniref:protein spaetzle isoform X2 n=1 Tax=Chironomus tepperi TaxID=113505 RepID=UPI00391F4CCD
MKFITFPCLLLLINEPIRSKKLEPSKSKTFMEDYPDYPKPYIKSLNLDKFELFFGSEYEETLGLRFDADEEGLCSSRRRTIFPKTAMTWNGSWLTIINNDDDKYRQGIVVEECVNETQQCKYHNNFPLGVQTRCKQSYTYRQLVAIDAVTNQPIRENFQFPSCCKCMYTSGHRSSLNRFGGDTDKVTTRRANSNNSEVITFPEPYN